MPYIPQNRREEIEAGDEPRTPGELNFAITRLCVRYCRLRWPEMTPSYADYNEIIGVLECAKLELYRRATAPYEDTKRLLNGDVYFPRRP